MSFDQTAPSLAAKARVPDARGLWPAHAWPCLAAQLAAEKRPPAGNRPPADTRKACRVDLLMGNTYSLYFSKQQKRQNENEYKGLMPGHSSYIYVDPKTGRQKEITEFVRDRYFLGFCIRGRPTWTDAELVFGSVPAASLRSMTHKPSS